MRYVGLDELRRIRQHATLRRWDLEKEPVESVDQAEESRLLGRAAVRDWKGLTLKGEDFPYSAENADLLMARWSEFAQMVGEVALDLVRLEDERLALSKKKSLTTSAPGAISEGSTATHAGT